MSIYTMACVFARYSNIFGQVGQGVHAYRIVNLAVVDILATVLGAHLLCLWLQYSSWTSYFCILVGLFLLGIAMHRLFCVRPPLIDLYLVSNHVRHPFVHLLVVAGVE